MSRFLSSRQNQPAPLPVFSSEFCYNYLENFNSLYEFALPFQISKFLNFLFLFFHHSLFVFVFVFFFETKSYTVAQAALKFKIHYLVLTGLKFMAILLPHPHQCWFYRHKPSRSHSFSESLSVHLNSPYVSSQTDANFVQIDAT